MEKFKSFSITYKGSKHDEKEDCQDASGNCNLENAVIAIVADGHGSSRCFRSHIGSREAVRITEKCIKYFINDSDTVFKNHMETANKGNDGKAELRGLGRQIIDKWFNSIMNDIKNNPLESETEKMEKIPDKYRNRYLLKEQGYGEDYLCHAYGTTLLAVAMTKNYWFGIQIGDGKCVVLYEDGSWSLPMPPDDRCSHNTTTSICDDEPVSSLSELRCWFGIKNDTGTYTEYAFGVDKQGHDVAEKTATHPLAIFIGSDGVEDSYPRIDNDKYVINFYRNRIISLAENGFEFFNEEIDGFAKRFADRESTDDVSIAGIIGDFTGKNEMIDKMKEDSSLHETGELISVKRRDAGEKKSALEAVEKRTKSIIDNQRQIESKIAIIEKERNDLEIKKNQLLAAHSKGKSEVDSCNREISNLRNKINELEYKKSERINHEGIVSSKIHIAEEEFNKAKKDFENDSQKLSKEHRKIEAKVERLQKLLGKTQSQPVDIRYDNKGKIINQVIIIPDISAGTNDIRAQSLKQDIDKTVTELTSLQAQVTTLKQNAETKNKEIIFLRKKFSDEQQRTRYVEDEIKRATQDFKTAQTNNVNYTEAVKQIQCEITKTDNLIKEKKMEIDKLNSELESLKEQTKKQTDTLDAVRTAWEKAEKEAHEIEASIKKI